jgi:hypothetical protein
MGVPQLKSDKWEIYPGEKEAIETVLMLGEEFGYGNLIAHLRKAWAEMLMEDNLRLLVRHAIEATNSSPYPLRKLKRLKAGMSEKGGDAVDNR